MPLETWKEWIRPFYLRWFYFRLKPEARPAHWAECWKFPEAGTGGPGQRPDVLFLPMVDWHARMQRAQHLARVLARLGHRCFYLNPNLGREYREPVLLRDPLAVCRLEEGIYEIHAGLPREPVFHHRMLSQDESLRLGALLERAARQFGIRELAVICQFPVWEAVANFLRNTFGGPLVYDCHDLLSGFSRISREIIDRENALLSKADIVLVSAKSLLEDKLRELPVLGERALLLRNGVDVNHFQPVAGGRRKVAGYVGSLDEWFDVEAVEQAATRYPEVEFVFLGRIEDRRVLTLERLPNVRFYGEIPYSRLPVYMAEFDIALIPFLVTPLTLATNPIKLYEYFSCGLPVVSASLPEIQPYSGLVYLSEGATDFAAQVGRALGEQDPGLRARRRQVAEGESWESRGRQLRDAITKRSGA